ncbi:MAG: metallophosphoesterase [Negativicutes bacterium]|nr:metallophosphoesterase [Negativicutes bacterium]
MRLSFATFISVFLLLFTTINYYIALRTWQTLGALLPVSAAAFWLLWWLFAATPIVNRIRRLYAIGSRSKAVALIGGYWIAITYYAFFAWLGADFLRLAASLLQVLPNDHVRPEVIGLVTWSAVFAVLAYGSWNASRPVVRRHRLAIAKSAGGLRRLSAVLVSDVHLGPIVANRRLESLVQLVNSLDPDIVFFAGDTIDENVTYFLDQGMPQLLRQLKTRLGAFAVLGNHEYIGGQAEQAAAALEASGITVLRDKVVKIADSFYLAGRDEYSLGRFSGAARATLAGIMTGVDRSLPVILLDHQPAALAESRQQGVDLQLSGHTHRGQFFPNNLITRRVFAVDWGYLRLGPLQVIVSSGYGTWGPPIRIGSRSEVVQIDIEFTE